MTGRRRCPISRKPVEFCRGTDFYTSCRAFRAVIALRFGFEIDYCRGLDADADLKKLVATPLTNQPQKEEAMGTVKRKLTVCDQCGAEKNTCMHYGKNVCSGCMSMRIAAKNNPNSVIAALAEFGHMPEPAEAKPGEDVGALLCEIETLKKVVGEKDAILRDTNQSHTLERIDNEQRITFLSELVFSYQKTCLDIAVELGHSSATEINLAAEVSFLKQEKDRLQELLDDAIAELDAQALTAKTPQTTDPARAGVLLDIVMDAMAGKITGLDVGRLQALR